MSVAIVIVHCLIEINQCCVVIVIINSFYRDPCLLVGRKLIEAID
jgi:hypothetical protein